MKAIERALLEARYLWKGHVANPLWRGSDARRRVRKREQERLKMDLLRQYLPFVKNLHASVSSMPENADSEERVFCLWLQGEENAPEIVRKCIARMRSRYGARFTMLDSRSLPEFITLPEFIMEKWHRGKIIPANFSDIVRIELLALYGGYWMDATVMPTGPVPPEIADSPFFMYVASSRFLSRMFVQTCFMHARKADPLLMMWRALVHEYWRRENSAIDYFLVHYLLKFLVANNPEGAGLFDRMPKLEQDATHELWYRIGDRPFQADLLHEMTEKAFFQKCSYRKGGGGLDHIRPGSMADHVINGDVWR